MSGLQVTQNEGRLFASAPSASSTATAPGRRLSSRACAAARGILPKRGKYQPFAYAREFPFCFARNTIYECIRWKLPPEAAPPLTQVYLWPFESETSLIKSMPETRPTCRDRQTRMTPPRTYGRSTSGSAIARALANGLWRRCGGHRHPRWFPPQILSRVLSAHAVLMVESSS